MDKRFIKALLEEGRMISDIPQEEALVKLNNNIMTVYVMNGLHRGLQPDAFKEEVRVCAVAMYQELTTDPAYKSIRDKEVPYIFSNGMKGRLNTDKDIGLSYKNLIRWIEGYVGHIERKEAMRAYREEHAPKPPKLPPHETTEDDYIRMVNDAWSDWCEYKVAEEKRKAAIKKGAFKKHGKEPKAIGEVFVFPISCRDFGRCKIGYLIRRKEAKDGDTLADIFGQAWESGYRGKLFISKK